MLLVVVAVAAWLANNQKSIRKTHLWATSWGGSYYMLHWLVAPIPCKLYEKRSILVARLLVVVAVAWLGAGRP